MLILCYHSVSEDWPEVGSIAPAILERQVRHLLGRGYTPRTLSAAIAEGAGRRSLVVTFDDAFRSVADLAFPILRAFGVPATLFVPTDHVSTGRPLAWSSLGRYLGTPWEGELSCMSWDLVRRLEAAGWEIGSHTATHPRLTELDDRTLADELTTSREGCEAELGHACRTLAFPFGAHDARVVAATAAAGYTYAVTLGERLLEPLRRDDPLCISRQGIYRRTTWRQFVLATVPALARARESAVYARLCGPPLRRGLQHR